jgi:2'-5' RNA ligase
MASKRLFFALMPDPGTCAGISDLQRRLSREHRIAGRPVKPERYHVTLAFLGNQDVGRLPLLLEVASSLRMQPCEVGLDCLGGFDRAGVGWLGASRVPSVLLRFQAGLVAALDGAGIEFDHRPWAFHLTLYRDLRTPLANMHTPTVHWQLDGFALVESISTGQGPEYARLANWHAVPGATEG